MVRRERSESDRRVVHIEITGKALGLLAQLDAPVLRLHKALLGHLTGRELRELCRLLEKARQPLSARG
jgi:DNA-binding MarR family transcriptional regulator